MSPELTGSLNIRSYRDGLVFGISRKREKYIKINYKMVSIGRRICAHGADSMQQP